MRRVIERAARMSAAEAAWRVGAAARIARDRVTAAVRRPAWDRRHLQAALASRGDLRSALNAARAHRWAEAHAVLSAHFASAPQRFVIAASLRASLPARIRQHFPASPAEAAGRADRVRAGELDLLGYRGLRVGEPPDWHYDPVHDRRAPAAQFWASVPYLDPSCGDHKIIWELNRHQHWLVLGRAWWLTGDASYRDVALAQLASWLEANPPLLGINWASMLELAFRSLSWLWALHFFVARPEDDVRPEAPWTVDLLVGLDRQLAQIAANLSYYFSPNTHLLGEALALYVAGRTLPELRDSGRYEAIGRRVLVDEIDRQIAPDGGHTERSTHYHRYTLDMYLLALAVARITSDGSARVFERAAARLAFAGRQLADDAGRVPHIGDDDGGTLAPVAGGDPDDLSPSLAVAAALVDRPDLRVGRAPENAYWMLASPALARALDASEAVAPPVPPPSIALPETGYYVSRSTGGAHLVIDAGPHGYQNGGHAHADALSLTLSMAGVPVLVDPGTACYTIDTARRDRFRGTALHNTLLLDGRPQSVPAGPFHWAETARAAPRTWRTNAAFDYFEGEHDGYAPAIHRRHLLVLHDDLLVVADLVIDPTGAAHDAAVHWQVDGRWRVDLVSPRRARLVAAGAAVDGVAAAGRVDVFTADVERGLGWQAPVYGRLEPAATIRVEQRGAAPLWIVTVFGLNAEDPVLDVEPMPVWAEAGVLVASAAIRITRRRSVDYCLFADKSGSDQKTWRVGEFETDARVLLCRTDLGRVTRVALVDGSLVRTPGGRLQLELPREVPDLHLDLARLTAEVSAETEARVSGPVFGATLIVAGRERPLAIERRAAQRRES